MLVVIDRGYSNEGYLKLFGKRILLESWWIGVGGFFLGETRFLALKRNAPFSSEEVHTFQFKNHSCETRDYKGSLVKRQADTLAIPPPELNILGDDKHRAVLPPRRASIEPQDPHSWRAVPDVRGKNKQKFLVHASSDQKPENIIH
ncbi:hypothetical protein KM043_008237 [Ampulex compressa]|nr:hypothetical protein KM043_008237 [Ampulex compressa]